MAEVWLPDEAPAAIVIVQTDASETTSNVR